MRMGESQRQLASDLAGIRRGDRRDAASELAQIESIHKLHGQVLHTGLRARIGGSDDAGMLQSPSGTNLAFEALQSLGRRPLDRDQFEGDNLLQLAMLGAIDNPHAAASDTLEDTILANGYWRCAGRKILAKTPLERPPRRIDSLLGFRGSGVGRVVEAGVLQRLAEQ